MKIVLPDLCDKYGDSLRVLSPMLKNFGGKSCFHGRISTIKCHEDNSLVADAVKEKGIKGTEVGFPVPWGIKGYFNAYLHEADDGPLKGKKLLRIFLNESFPNPGW